MTERQSSFRGLVREHPIFFWGMVTLISLLVLATVLVAVRVPSYRAEAAEIDEQMSLEERQTRDRILESRTRRSELAVALLQREMRLKALSVKGVHVAISTEDSTLALKHGPATLREIKVVIGGDSIVTAPNGQTWRFVRALGERHVDTKVVGGSYTVPEWVYASRGQPIPGAGERELDNGLGQYVLRLDDGTEIYSRPESGPFAQGVKPASFLVESESELRAIMDAIGRETPVFIY